MWPGFFTLGATQIVRGEVHLTADRNGTFALTRRGIQGTMPLLAAALLGSVLVGVLLGVVWRYVPAVYFVCVSALVICGTASVVGVATIVLAQGNRAALTEVDGKTPKGRRWSVSSLAQRPGTYWSALDAIKLRLESLPRGSVVVAVAGDEKLQRMYVKRGGFTEGTKLRIHREIPLIPPVSNPIGYDHD